MTRSRAGGVLVPVAVALVVVGLVGVGVRWAVDNTLTRHAGVTPGSRLEVVVAAERHDAAEHGEPAMVEALVALCQLEVGADVSGPVEPLGAGRYRFETVPSLDAADQRQLEGCLEDLRVDHFLADVVAMVHHEP